MEFNDEKGNAYKVTRRMSEFSVAETKIFRSKEEAFKQFEQWLWLFRLTAARVQADYIGICPGYLGILSSFAYTIQGIF